MSLFHFFHNQLCCFSFIKSFGSFILILFKVLQGPFVLVYRLLSIIFLNTVSIEFI